MVVGVRRSETVPTTVCGMAPESSVSSPIPELLSPAGDWDCAKAAVANGADAVYFGLDSGFNARARAANFSLEELPELLAFLHRHGVAGYVTINILAFSDELESLEADGAQDRRGRGGCGARPGSGPGPLIRRVAPELSIHASTQMSLTSAECINKAQQLGIDRVVLARELSVREIAMIHRADHRAAGGLCPRGTVRGVQWPVPDE